MAGEEIVRYWGETEADRRAAFEKDAAARLAAGWRPAEQRTEFVFGKSGMDLIVTYVPKESRQAAPAEGPSPASEPQAHFDLNGAITRATSPAPARDVAPNAPGLVPTVEAAPDEDSDPAEVEEPAEAESSDDAGDAEPTSLSREEALRLFGVNGEDVAWLLDSLPSIDDDTAERIAEAYGGIADDDRDAAGRRLRDFDGPPYADRLAAAENLVNEWVDSLGKKGNDQALYDIVGCAAIDAVDALVLEDELDDDTFGTLYWPWQSVMDPDDGDHEADETGDAAEAIEDAAVFGPNTDLVLEFFEALAGLSEDQVRELGTPPDSLRVDRLRRARNRLLKLAHEKKRWAEQCDAAGREVDRWSSRLQGEHFDYSSGEGSLSDRAAASLTVVYAVSALLLADVLHPGDAARLYSAWSLTVGRPSMPVYEDD